MSITTDRARYPRIMRHMAANYRTGEVVACTNAAGLRYRLAMLNRYYGSYARAWVFVHGRDADECRAKLAAKFEAKRLAGRLVWEVA